MTSRRLLFALLACTLLPVSTLRASEAPHVWSRVFGVYGDARIADVATDGAGNIVVVGTFDGMLDLGGDGPLYGEGNRDIFLARLDADGHAVWSRRFGSFEYEIPTSVAIDASGNVVITGWFRHSIDFGGGTLTSAGNQDIFLAAFDTDGNHRWSKRFGDSRNQVGEVVGIDGSGHILLMGSAEGTVDFGGGPMVSPFRAAVFLAAFNADGQHLWSHGFRGDDYQTGYGLAVNAAGTVAIVGTFRDTVDFGGGPIGSVAGTDLFVASYDAEGHHRWSRGFGTAGSEGAEAAAMDAAGNLSVTGYMTGTLDFGGGPLTSAGGYDAFLVRFDPDGNHLSSRSFGTGSGNDEWGADLALTPSGGLILRGFFEGTIDFGGGPLTSTDSPDQFLLALDDASNHLWSRSHANVLSDDGSIAVDPAGNVLIGATFDGTVDPGGGPFMSYQNPNAFIAKLDATGQHTWSHGLAPESGYGAAAAAVATTTGHSIVTGQMEGTIDFGNGPRTAPSGSDIFLAAFDASGNPLWDRTFGNGQYQEGHGLASDRNGGVVLSGRVYGALDVGGGVLPAGPTGLGTLLARFDASGQHVWSQRFQRTSFYVRTWVAVDDANNIFLTGDFEGTLELGGDPLVASGGRDVFLAKFDPDGHHLWSRRFGDTTMQWPRAIATDAMGNVAIAGSFTGTIDFGGGPLTSPVGVDPFVARFDGDGNHLWSRRFGDSAHQEGSAVDMDGAGNVVLTGSFNGTLDLGGGPLTLVRIDDIFLARFDTAGEHVWSKSFSGILEWSSGVLFGDGGDVFLAGHFSDWIDLGGGQLPGRGQRDAFLARYDAAGNHLDSRTFGDNLELQVLSMGPGVSGGVFLAGSLNGAADFGGGAIHGGQFGNPFVACFDASMVPVRIAGFDATVEPGAVEIAWEAWSDDSGDRFSLVRSDRANTRMVAIAEGALERSRRSYRDTDVAPAITYEYQLVIHATDGTDYRSATITVTTPAVPLSLAQNTPNPFRQGTSIGFTLGKPARAVVTIHDVAGRLVTRLDQGVVAAGSHEVSWDGRDDRGRMVEGGVYFYRLESGNEVVQRKLIRLP